MWMLEKDNDEVKPNFDSVPRSMYYTLLMMFGEFPITDFTPPGKVTALCSAPLKSNQSYYHFYVRFVLRHQSKKGGIRLRSATCLPSSALGLW